MFAGSTFPRGEGSGRGGFACVHFKETLAFLLQTAPASASCMLTPCRNTERQLNAPAGAAESTLGWLLSKLLDYQVIFHSPEYRNSPPGRAAKFQNSLKVSHWGRKKTSSRFSANGTNVNFKTTNSVEVTFYSTSFQARSYLCIK